MKAFQGIGPIYVNGWRSEVAICAYESSELPRIMALEGFIDLSTNGTNLIRRSRSCRLPECGCGGNDEE
jgi:hypothetical protein